ncbi:putative bifunctional diguanylate cyclase/phosphodiesterase [Streptomyces sp. NPDC091376]|uniref:putative bifunctional diguanylate cyclase/phosphodiesterase n=1 Tax=Streptomyces sp. NPDC091376 TaxID=3365994 RepID=UPI00381C3ACE
MNPSPKGADYALVWLGIDHFHSISNTLGPNLANRFMSLSASRLEVARRRERPRGILTRTGNSDFALLLTEPEIPASLVELAQLLLSELAKPVQIDGRRLILEATAGICVQRDGIQSTDALYRGAQAAVRDARRDNQRTQLWDATRDLGKTDRSRLLADLWHALASGDVHLHYQPQVTFEGLTVGLEALVRWNRGGQGFVPPDEFIAVAEASWLMPRLTEYLLDVAIEQSARWRALGIDVPVAVNISPRDVMSPGFARRVSNSLTLHQVPANSLRLEITENTLIDNCRQAAQSLAGLRRLGVRVSLDDFGTGHSSLSRLRDLPVDEMKIDRSFIAGLTTNPRDAALVQWSIDLAHALGLTTVAEGVEDAQTWERLRDMGADVVQGWVVSPALPADHVTNWLLDKRLRLPQL